MWEVNGFHAMLFQPRALATGYEPQASSETRDERRRKKEKCQLKVANVLNPERVQID